jgi:hypothetical protein
MKNTHILSLGMLLFFSACSNEEISETDIDRSEQVSTTTEVVTQSATTISEPETTETNATPPAEEEKKEPSFGERVRHGDASLKNWKLIANQALKEKVNNAVILDDFTALLIYYHYQKNVNVNEIGNFIPEYDRYLSEYESANEFEKRAMQSADELFAEKVNVFSSLSDQLVSGYFLLHEEEVKLEAYDFEKGSFPIDDNEDLKSIYRSVEDRTAYSRAMLEMINKRAAYNNRSWRYLSVSIEMPRMESFFPENRLVHLQEHHSQ